ncbi:MAG: hypothetical protein OHK0029_00590 [Armatimonadaceae bacterium]
MPYPSFPLWLRRSLPLWAVLALTLAIALPPCLPAIERSVRGWSKPELPSWVGAEPGKAKPGERIRDVDTYLIHGGLVQAPTFRDTLRWWYGTWVGQVPFYRPLTSLLFWTQWQFWREQEARYNLVATLLHLTAVVCLAALAYHLFLHFEMPRPDLGTLVACYLFTYSTGLLDSQNAITYDVFGMWKNQPDSLTLIFFSLSLLSYLRGRNGIGAAIWYLLACLTKEAGVFLPLVLPLLEAPNLRAGGQMRRVALRRMAPLFAVLLVYLPARALFLGQAVGFRYGSNEAWYYRLGISFLGRVSKAVYTLQWIEIALTGAIFGVTLVWKRWFRQPLLALLLTLGCLLALSALGAGEVYRASGVPWDFAAGFLYVVGEIGVRALYHAAVLWLTITAFRERFWFAAAVYVWALLALGLTLFSPTVHHRDYLINAGFVLLWSGGTVLVLQRLLPATQPANTALY